MSKKLGLLLVLAAIGLICGQATAATVSYLGTYTGAGGNDLEATAGNWSWAGSIPSGGVPAKSAGGIAYQGTYTWEELVFAAGTQSEITDPGNVGPDIVTFQGTSNFTVNGSLNLNQGVFDINALTPETFSQRWCDRRELAPRRPQRRRPG
jgi:hypothetical protein